MSPIRQRLLLVAIGIAALLLAGTVRAELPAADTVPGAHNHPLLSRDARSRLVGCQGKEFDSTPLVAGRYGNSPGQPEGHAFEEVVEPVEMETDKVQVDLSAQPMSDRIDADGKVALYGLYFDTDQSTVRRDSKPTLEQMTRLLQQQPKLASNDSEASPARNRRVELVKQ